MKKSKNNQMNPSKIEEAKKASTIAVYGKDGWLFFEPLRDWLAESPHHQLVFFQDEPSTLNLEDHPQVHVALLHDQEAYALLSPDFYFLSIEQDEKVHAQLLQDVYSVHAYLADLWLYKEQANIYYHLAHLDEYSPSKPLINYFKNSQFIICGAGPSLEGYLDLLKTKKGILVGAGTALNILNDFGIQADLGMVFDSKATGARRLQSNNAFSIPFLVDLDATDGVKYLSGQKILTKQAKLAPWKEKLLSQLGIQNELMEIGPSISSTHYALEAAVKLGASEVMLLGVDLAYIKGKQYAGKKTWLLDEESPVPIDARTDLIQLSGTLSASRIFLKERELFSNLAGQFPQVKFYDGLCVDFSKWQENVSEPKNLKQQSKFGISPQDVKKVLQDWKKELLNTPNLLLEGYLKRLELKFAAKKQFTQKQAEIDAFCKKVVDFHLDCLDEALDEIEEKIAFPDRDHSEDKFESDGTVKLYYSNGQLKSAIDYLKGRRQGLYRFFSRSGKLLEEGHYQNGIPLGLYRQWNRGGNLEKEIFSHSNGRFDLLEWDEQGKIIREVKSGHLFKKEVDSLKESLDGLLKEL